MAAKWAQKIKEKLKANPLYLVDTTPLCEACGGKKLGGKKMALYMVTNYSNLGWDRCSACKTEYR